MISLIQRVSQASVTIDGIQSAQITPGMLALIGIEKADCQQTADQLADRLLGYRIFADDQGKMNLDIRAFGGEILLVPQFTLVADTSKGRRPGFSLAAPPQQASALFSYLVSVIESQLEHVQQGTFGADMKVALVNDGPVTFWIRVDPSL